MAIFDFLWVIPYTNMLYLVVLSVLFILHFSIKNKLNFIKEMFRYIKGIMFMVLLCLIVFSTTIFLKYMSFLKIDILQIELSHITIIVGIAIIVLFEYSLKSFEEIAEMISKTPYVVKQITVFSVVFIVLSAVTDEVESRIILAASVVPSVVYHLIYVKAYKQIIGLLRYTSRLYDKITGVRKK